MLILTTARIKSKAIIWGLGNDWWCLVGHKLWSPGWKSGVTLHSTLTSTPLDTYSRRKVYCSSSSVQVIWNNADGFRFQVQPCLVPKGAPRASGWGSTAKRYVSSCGEDRVGVDVFTLLRPAQRRRPAYKCGSVSMKVRTENKGKGVRPPPVTITSEVQGRRAFCRNVRVCTTELHSEGGKSIMRLKYTETNCQRGWFMARNLDSSSAGDPAAASVCIQGSTLLPDLLLDVLLVSELI